MDSSPNSIQFDDIHTKRKQTELRERLEEISREIHLLFPRGESVSSCPICESHSIEFLTTKFRFDIDQCRECGQIFCNPMPQPAALSYYYNSEFKSFENQFFLDSFEKRIPIFSFRIDALIKHCRGRSILDIGSGVGIFLEANKRAGLPFQITSCDLNRQALDTIKAKYPDTSVICSDVDDLSAGAFDAVTLWDVLEHLPDPGASVRKVSGLLKQDGVIAISTPNTRSLEWSIAGLDHPQLIPPGHINLFNATSIALCLDRNGFDVEFLETPNGSLDVSYVRKLIKHEEIHQMTNSTYSSKLLASIFDGDLAKHFASCVAAAKYAGNTFVIGRKR